MFGALQLEGCGFESTSKPPRRDPGQVLHSQLLMRFGVKLRFSVRAVVGSASEWESGRGAITSVQIQYNTINTICDSILVSFSQSLLLYPCNCDFLRYYPFSLQELLYTQASYLYSWRYIISELDAVIDLRRMHCTLCSLTLHPIRLRSPFKMYTTDLSTVIKDVNWSLVYNLLPSLKRQKLLTLDCLKI